MKWEEGRKIEVVLFMRRLGIKIKRIAELLPISKSTLYRRGIRRKTTNRRINETVNRAAISSPSQCSAMDKGKGRYEDKDEMYKVMSSAVTDTAINKENNKDSFLINRINQIALKYPFYGYRRIYALLRREGILVNYKKVYRIYKELNLQRPKNKKKKAKARNSLIESIPSLALNTPSYPKNLWVTDFIHDTLLNNRALRVLIIQDAYTKKVVGYRIDRSITAEEVVDTLIHSTGQ